MDFKNKKMAVSFSIFEVLFKSKITLIVVLSIMFELALLRNEPILAIILITASGTFLISRELAITSRIVFSFILNFSLLTLLLLLLGFIRFETLNSGFRANILLSLVNIFYLLTAILVE